MLWDSFHRSKRLLQNSLGLGCSAGKESACNAGDLGSIPGLGRSPGEVKVYSLQYSGLENSMDCIVHEHTESDTTERLSLSGCLPTKDCFSQPPLVIKQSRTTGYHVVHVEGVIWAHGQVTEIPR